MTFRIERAEGELRLSAYNKKVEQDFSHSTEKIGVDFIKVHTGHRPYRTTSKKYRFEFKLSPCIRTSLRAAFSES